jgi:hypothetical protein
MIFRSELWLQAVRDIGKCMNCDAVCRPDPAHRNEGKGMGLKQHDSLVAALCRKCHDLLDQGSRLGREERRALWNRAYARTMQWLTDAGFFDQLAIRERGYRPPSKIIPRAAA